MKWLVALSAITVASPALASDCQVNMRQYAEVRLRMLFIDVIDLLGCDGVMSSGEATGEKMTFVWDGTAAGSTMSVTFQDDVVVWKAQRGLK